MSRICVTGIWHQGAVLAAGFADLGHDVRAVVAREDVAPFTAGQLPVREPGLPDVVARGTASGRLVFDDDLVRSLEGAEVALISTDTPVGDDDEPLTDTVYALARAVAAARHSPLILCVTAQVPVGTTEELGAIVGCPVVYCPEFLRLGSALESFRKPDRIVIGAGDAGAAAAVRALWAPLNAPIVETDVRTAEMAKHAANAFLATSISFANETSDIADAVGADALAVAEILRLDRRIGPQAFLTPGLGFAGGTLGRELRALQRLAQENGLRTRLLDAVAEVNAGRPVLVRRTLDRALGGLHGQRVALLGLTYKSGTSTLRRSAAMGIARELAAAGASVRAFDPSADFAEVEGPVPFELCSSAYDAAAGSAAVAVLTEPEGWDLDFDRLRTAMDGDVLLDARAAVDRDAVEAAGFRYLRLSGAA